MTDYPLQSKDRGNLAGLPSQQRTDLHGREWQEQQTDLLYRVPSRLRLCSWGCRALCRAALLSGMSRFWLRVRHNSIAVSWLSTSISSNME